MVEQVARGILLAAKDLVVTKPIVIRFDGNAAAEGLRILDEAGNPNLHVRASMEEAAATAVTLAAAAKEARR
jgi:succinyl-CoA synthetase beta subunit